MRNYASGGGQRSAPGNTPDATAVSVAFLMTLVLNACGGSSADVSRLNNHESAERLDAGREAGVGGESDASRTSESKPNDARLDDAGSERGSSGAGEESTDVGEERTDLDSSSADSGSTTSSTQSATSTGEASNDTETTTDDTDETLAPGWERVAPVAEGLSDCRANLQQNETWCSFPVSCGETSLTSRCELREGVWQCTCQNGSAPKREYTLAGELVATACEASIALCAPGQPPEPPPVCEIDNESISNDSCVAAETCVTTVELTERLTASVTVRTGYSECSGEPGQLDCGCRDAAGAPQLFEIPMEEACRAIVPWCQEGVPVPDETWDFRCLDDVTSGDRDPDPEDDVELCFVQRQCGRRFQIGEGFALFFEALQSVECEGSGCTCGGEHHLLVSSLEGSAEESCAMVDEFCYGEAAASPSGSISVTSVETEGDETACSGAATAEQWVSWSEGDQEMSVGLTGDIWTFCDHLGSLNWSCRCASSGSGSDTFELSGADSAETCEGALDQCIARARVVPGLNSMHPHRARFEFLPESAAADAGPSPEL